MLKKNKLILFDLDYTLVKCDTLKLLVLFFFKKNFIYFLYKFPILAKIVITHFFSSCPHKTKTKSKFYSKLLEGYTKEQIEIISAEFAKYIFFKYKNMKLYRILLKSQKLGFNNFIVTASGDFYCKHLADLFKTKLISTKVSLNKKSLGKIIGKNCYGDEKKKKS